MGFGGYLKADTEIKVVIGPVVAVGDGFTPVTNLALNTADEAEIMKHNAAAVTDISAYTFAAIANADGYYNLTLAAGGLDTEGRLTVLINDDSLCLPVRADFMVVNANVFDSMFAAATTDYLKSDTIQWLGQAVTADTNVPEVHVVGLDNAVLAAAKFAGDFLTSAKIADDAFAVEHFAAAFINNASFAADVGSTAHGTNIIALACRKILEELNLDHLLKVAVSNRDTLPEVVDDTILANLMTKTDGDTSDFDHALHSLEAIKDLVSALNNISTANVNTEVDNALNTAIPGAPTADSINQYIQQLKWVLVNQMAITEASGNVEGKKDDDATAAYTVAAAFTTAAGITTRKRLE